MTIFRDLLAIKRFREGKAEIALHKQRAVLREATEQRDEADSARQDYHVFAVEHERSLFHDLCSRTVKLRDIEDVQHAVVILREQERAHEKALEEAESHRENQAREYELRKDEHATAYRKKEKFVELAQAYAAGELREFERKEDAEMEEAAAIRRERVEWGSAEEEAFA